MLIQPYLAWDIEPGPAYGFNRGSFLFFREWYDGLFRVLDTAGQNRQRQNEEKMLHYRALILLLTKFDKRFTVLVGCVAVARRLGFTQCTQCRGMHMQEEQNLGQPPIVLDGGNMDSEVVIEILNEFTKLIQLIDIAIERRNTDIMRDH